MSKYPDNIVFDYEKKEYNAYKKEYPTTSSAPNFSVDLIDKNLPHECKSYFETQLKELQNKYEKIKREYEWTELIYKSDYRFKPDIGSTYHLYKKDNNTNFLSLVDPESWEKTHLGSFKLLSFGKWQKI
tara:strand:- start:93 stop:479 length:387 start_codon:yes stop_codon:yes gene_type:complete